MSDPTTTQLRYLESALRTGSWTTAADELGVSPSAFAQGIRELERRLGIVLFDKEGRTRVPTDAAPVATEHAHRILSAYGDLERWAEQLRDGDTGVIRAGMIDTAAVHHFGDALVRFQQTHPGLRVRLSVRPSAQLIEELRRGEHDVIVAVRPRDPAGLEMQPLVDEPVYIYGPSGRDRSVGQDAWGPWVTFPADSYTRRLAAFELRARGIPFDVIAESSQPAVIREMVRLGMGWTVLPAVDAEREPHALKRASADPITIRELTLVRVAGRSLTPALERFIAMLLSERPSGAT